MMTNCSLCLTPDVAPFAVIKKPERSYFHCAKCDFIFMNPDERLSLKDEKARYDLHENKETPGYLAFFEPLLADIELYFNVGESQREGASTALDFGCGPTATLAHKLAERNFDVAKYDPFYYPNHEVFRKTYDLITSTEVWEHLYEPRLEIERQIRLLKKGGILAIMTSSHKGESAFHDWHYRRDLTHVAFYSEKTMSWLAQNYGLQILKMRSPYWLFSK